MAFYLNGREVVKKKLPISNRFFVEVLNKRSFHLPNWKFLIKLSKKVFKVRIVRGRGPRVVAAAKDGVYKSKYQQTLPLRHATYVHVYLMED